MSAYVPSDSMENTIMVGDKYVVNKLAFVFAPPKRGQIIVFHFPDDEKQLFVKRIIAIPGDIVRIKDGLVYVNFKQLDEPYKFSTHVNTGENYNTLLVPPNSYFMMGDNREVSDDSRYWKHTFVKKEEIVGSIFCRYYPKLGFIK